MKRRLIHVGVAAVAMILCAAVALAVPPLWQGVSGRDFRPQATTMAILILGVGIALRRGLRWPVADLILGLLLTEIVTLSIIAKLSGSTWPETFNPFNLWWLAFMNIFIGLPWLLALVIGSVWLGYSNRHGRAAWHR
jgi:hypothetical protein